MKLSPRDFERAKTKYLGKLARDPADFAARNDLGLLLWNAGKRQEAFELFLETVRLHPQNATAHANLAFAFLRGGALEQARALYEMALRLDPAHVDAKRGLAAVLAQSGTSAADLREVAASADAVTVIPYRGKGTPIAITVLVSLGSGNVHIERLLDERTFATTKVVVELFEASGALPAHDLIFNAIGDADSCAEALVSAQRLVANQAAVLNRPDRVAATTRSANAERLGRIPGVVTARTQLVARADLQEPSAADALTRSGLHFPLLLRSPGHHTGHHFVRVENADALATAAAELPGDALYAIDFIDVRAGDGKVRKFRVMFVDGKLYPLHLAVSPDWKVHYFSAQMADYPEHRAEDEAFLNDMEALLGGDAIAALHRIAEELGLDYAGIDFALSPNREIVVFEANATMVVVQPHDDERWAYRKLPVRRVTTAVRNMLVAKAASRARAI